MKKNHWMDAWIVSFSFGWLLTLGNSLSAQSLPIAELPADQEITYSRDIAPVLRKNCLACHNINKQEGGVNLESLATMQSSPVDEVIVPGKPDSSRIFVLASHASDPVMPPEDNDVSAAALTPMELALLRRWIETGAAVDASSSLPSHSQWQPLPADVQTIFGSAMTTDGRLAAVSFGNQVRMFGANSTRPLGSLQFRSADQVRPAHEDFVQDLHITSDGRRVLSAGFRNIKFWHLSPFDSHSIPAIQASDVLKTVINAPGSHLAVLSPRGEISVAAVGQNRWQWLKGFDAPESFQSDSPPSIHMAIDSTGQQVAVAWQDSIRVASIDGVEIATLDSGHDVTTMTWTDTTELILGDASGQLTRWNKTENQWMSLHQLVTDQPIVHLFHVSKNDSSIIAVDRSGKIIGWTPEQNRHEERGRLPSEFASVAISPSGQTLWMTTRSGQMGRFDLADQKYLELSKYDPAADFDHQSKQWQVLVGEKRVEAEDKLVKQAQANATAEKTSLDTLEKEIEAKLVAITEKETGVQEAQAAAQKANELLAQSRAEEQTNLAMRNEYESALKSADAEIKTLEQRLTEQKKQKEATEKQLAALPDPGKLAEAIKVQTTALDQAEKDLAAKNNALQQEQSALKSARETLVRGQTRLTGLDTEVLNRQQQLETIKSVQQTLVDQTAAAKVIVDQSTASEPNSLALLDGGTRLLSRSTSSQSSQRWNLWSGSGDWIGTLPDLPDGELIAAGDQCLLLRRADGTTIALVNSDQLWQLERTIGSTLGDSPFADRVLCIDVSPNGQLVVTGGGQPSRSGELMVWNATDGSLVRSFENPHGDTVLCARFSPDGRILATGGADRIINLWDVETGALIKSLEGHTHHVTALAWHLNGQQLASGSADASVKIWDVQSGQSTRTIEGLKSEITRLVYLGRDDRIGVACGDSYFRVYRTDNGGRETDAKLGDGYLYALDANRDGTRLIIGGAEGVATVVDRSGKPLLRYESTAESGKMDAATPIQ